MNSWFLKLRKEMSLGLTVSVLAHLAIVAVLLLSWNLEEQKPQQEEAVTVEIVETPEEEPEPVEEQQKEEPEPTEEQQQEEEQQAQEEPPAPTPQEQAEQQQQQQQAAANPAGGQPIERLRPVFEFGEEAGGPKISQEGNSARGEIRDENSETEEEDAAIEESEVPEPAKPEPPPPQLTAESSSNAIAEIIESDVAEAADTSDQPEPEEKTEDTLSQASTIFSETGTGAKNAVTAMANLPRGIRGGQLCATELREQLRHASPAINPQILPAYRFPEGNSMQVNKGAFRDKSGWHDIRFQCDIDAKGTHITGFAFEVGPPIPREDWAKRGLPEN